MEKAVLRKPPLCKPAALAAAMMTCSHTQLPGQM